MTGRWSRLQISPPPQWWRQGSGGSGQARVTDREESESHRAKTGDLCQHEEIKLRGQAMGHWGSLRTTRERSPWQGWPGSRCFYGESPGLLGAVVPPGESGPRCSVQLSSVTWQHGLPLAGSAWKLLPRWWGDHLV